MMKIMMIFIGLWVLTVVGGGLYGGSWVLQGGALNSGCMFLKNSRDKSEKFRIEREKESKKWGMRFK